MRIAFANSLGVKAGGTEHYIDRVLSDLSAAGHQVALLCEHFNEQGRPVTLPPGAPRICADALGAAEAVRQLFAWGPDILYLHGLEDPALEERLLAGHHPSVYFPHVYVDTCISGTKAHALPIIRPCDRVFGPACLALYLPRRCGGKNPLTMTRMYRLRARKLRLLPKYDAVVTHSEHMRREYMRHGVDPRHVRTIPYTSTLGEERNYALARAKGEALRPVLAARERPTSDAPPLRVLFVSRMEAMKGGAELIDALPLVAESLGVPVHAVMAGEGGKREPWTRQAEQVSARHPRVTFEFPGWIGAEVARARMAESHVLAFPSLWPEPYGLSGVEALVQGLPVVGFAVGGVPDWLHDGVNGCLAPGDPPTVRGLADAFVRATRDPQTFASLCEGALRSLEGRTPALHLRELLGLFEEVLAARAGASLPAAASGR